MSRFETAIELLNKTEFGTVLVAFAAANYLGLGIDRDEPLRKGKTPDKDETPLATAIDYATVIFDQIVASEKLAKRYGPGDESRDYSVTAEEQKRLGPQMVLDSKWEGIDPRSLLTPSPVMTLFSEKTAMEMAMTNKLREEIKEVLGLDQERHVPIFEPGMRLIAGIRKFVVLGSGPA